MDSDKIIMIIITYGNTLDPVVKIAEVEYATFCTFTESYFLSFIVVLCNSAG